MIHIRIRIFFDTYTHTCMKLYFSLRTVSQIYYTSHTHIYLLAYIHYMHAYIYITYNIYHTHLLCLMLTLYIFSLKYYIYHTYTLWVSEWPIYISEYMTRIYQCNTLLACLSLTYIHIWETLWLRIPVHWQTFHEVLTLEASIF